MTRRPTVLQVDPAGTTAIGLARVSDDGVSLFVVRPLDEPNGSMSRTWVERLRPALEGLAVGVEVVGVEKPPPTMGKASGRAGSQAVIGLSIGRVSGHVEGWAADKGFQVRLIEVGPWRTWRDHEIAIRRVVLPPIEQGALCRLLGVVPSADRRSVQRTWSCGTTDVIRAQLDRSVSSTCPKCNKRSARDASDAKTDREKARSWALASHLWPEVVSTITERARRTATGKDAATRPPWRLVGVADACEAGLQGMALRASWLA